VMLDEQIHGAVHRVSPEAPVPVVQVTSRSHHPGGAANVAMNIVALTGVAELCGVCGQDEASKILREKLVGVGTSSLVESTRRCTSRKSRVLAHGYHHIVRFDEEVTAPLDATEEQTLWNSLAGVIAESEALVLSDYAKGVLTPSLCRRAIDAARSKEIPVIVDPKAADFTRYTGATVITPNYGEGAAAARRLRPDLDLDESDAAAEQIGEVLVAAFGCSLVLTRGARGMSVFSATGDRPVHIAARARRVFDVTGAGDTVVAVLAMALAAGLPLHEAAAMSTEAAGRVIELPGTAAVTFEELWRS
jgi:rfaE bifunctional protein kinase chain/domain